MWLSEFLTGTISGYSVVVLYHGDPGVLDLPIQPLYYELQQFVVEVNVGEG